MTENRGTWTDLIGGVGLEIAEVFDQGQEEYRPGIGSVLMTGSGTGAQETYFGKTGAGEAVKFDEGAPVPLGRRYPTYKTTVVWNNYGKGVQVTKNAIEDRTFSAELDEMKDLSIGIGYSQDRSGMQLFNGGYATTQSVNGYQMTWYGDGEPAFSTVHSTNVPGESTQSNASATGIPFNGDNLETGHVALLEQQTDDGMPLQLLGKVSAVLPPALRKEGLEITGSQLDPESANNAINVYRNGMDTDMVMSLFLSASNGGSDTAWSLVVPGRTRFMHITRQAPQLDQDIDVLTKTVTFTVDARWANCVKDWRRSWGSKGNSATYSS